MEHRSVKLRCPCRKLNAGTSPKESTTPASYGPNVRVTMLYLLFDKHLSVEPTADIMSTILGAKVSTGFVAPLANEAASGLTWFIDVIRRRPTPNLVAHANETSAQVPIAKWWFHAVSNGLHAHLFASPTRVTSAPTRQACSPSSLG
ncbi:MAG: IS66 family transposase [Ferrimicrobium sp.]